MCGSLYIERDVGGDRPSRLKSFGRENHTKKQSCGAVDGRDVLVQCRALANNPAFISYDVLESAGALQPPSNVLIRSVQFQKIFKTLEFAFPVMSQTSLSQISACSA